MISIAINDLRPAGGCIKATKEFTLFKDFLVPLMHHDMRDLVYLSTLGVAQVQHMV